MNNNNEPQCPPLPPALAKQWERRPGGLCDDYQDAAKWGFDQGLAAGRQLGADEELEAVCDWLQQNTRDHVAIAFLRDARRPPELTVREQAIKALRKRLADVNRVFNSAPNNEAMKLALQALEEAGDE